MRAADNPFATHRILRQRYRLDDDAWARLFDRLARLNWRAAIVGPKGSGKTTLLEDLEARLRRRGVRTHLLRLYADQRRLPRDAPRWGANDVVLCDGAEQLSAFDWWRLRLRTARARGLVITTHRAGRLRTLHRCATSPAILRDLTTSLGVPLAAPDGDALFARHAGNVRNALRELYDRASAAAPGR